MSDKIEVGDWVMVVRGTTCCGKFGTLGETFKVARLSSYSGNCPYHCGYYGKEVPYAEASYHSNGYRIERLKKIPPISESESTEQRETVKA